MGLNSTLFTLFFQAFFHGERYRERRFTLYPIQQLCGYLGLYFAWKGHEKVLEVLLKILQIGTLGPMAWIIIEETKKMAIRLNPVGEMNLHGKNLTLSQAVRKMNFSSRKLAENQAGRDSSQQLAVSSC